MSGPGIERKQGARERERVLGMGERERLHKFAAVVGLGWVGGQEEKGALPVMVGGGQHGRTGIFTAATPARQGVLELGVR